jgi:hypothetical protein
MLVKVVDGGCFGGGGYRGINDHQFYKKDFAYDVSKLR